ncbi:MAG: hypothetical protein ACR2PQ_03300 [Myxococcota bacterium]
MSMIEEHAVLPAGASHAYEPPRFEVIPLDCEITAYAPDGEDPLF